ncbi:MAG TPA: hypothetical protein VD884_21170 [Ohtaekwangia sp.]|nr:hypothetical protein [Ohtaekwangia sp.]
MKQLFIKYFLSLGILLLSGNQLHKPSCDTDTPAVSSELNQNTTRFSLSSEKVLGSFKKIDSSDKNETPYIEAAEVRKDEDDKGELVPAKRDKHQRDSFSFVYCALTHAYLLSYVKHTLHFCRHFSDIPSRHLLFRVFRI